MKPFFIHVFTSPPSKIPSSTSQLFPACTRLHRHIQYPPAGSRSWQDSSSLQLSQHPHLWYNIHEHFLHSGGGFCFYHPAVVHVCQSPAAGAKISSSLPPPDPYCFSPASLTYHPARLQLRSFSGMCHSVPISLRTYPRHWPTISLCFICPLELHQLHGIFRSCRQLSVPRHRHVTQRQ